MYAILTKGRWLVVILVVLAVGGTIAVVSQRQQVAARGELNLLEAAHYNIELATQAALDEALGQQSLAFTDGDAEALDERASYLRAITDRGEEELVRWREAVDAAVADYRPGDLVSISLALDQLRAATMPPVRQQQRAAGDRVLWAVVLTVGVAAALAGIEYRRPRGDRS